MSIGGKQPQTYLSLNPAPAFELTEITASSKLHDEAAWTNPEPARRSEGINERRNRIVELLLKYCGALKRSRGHLESSEHISA